MPTARFSADGRHIAIGTADGAVHVFEAETLLRGAESPLRRYGDHSDAVNDFDFHPTSPVLVSGSEDATLQFYDVANSHTGPTRTCTDTHPIRSAAFHPKGDHLLVGTTHAALHLYDTATFRCFLSADPSHHHRAGITDARWAADGSLFASCAAAEVKLWDGASVACVATLSRPHGGTPVGSVAFSRSGHHLLTSGADSAVKLWDVRAVRTSASSAEGGRVVPIPVRTYEGGGCSSARRVACFSHDEALVLGADEGSCAALVWATNFAGANAASQAAANGGGGAAGGGAGAAGGSEVISKCMGHMRPVRCVAHAPSAPAFVTCAEDGAVRVWAQ